MSRARRDTEPSPQPTACGKASGGGRYSFADLHLGAGSQTVMTEGLVRLTVHAGAGAADIAGAKAEDTLHAGAGTARFHGGDRTDTVVFGPGDGAVTWTDFRPGEDVLTLLGTAPGSVHTALTQDGAVPALRITVDGQAGHVLLHRVQALLDGDLVFG